MENYIEIIIFLAIGLLSAIARGKKKKKQDQPAQRQEPDTRRPQQTKPKKTFEELLREIREAQQEEAAPPRETTPPPPKPAPVVDHEFHDGERYDEQKEEYVHDDKEAHSTYQKSLKQAKDLTPLADKLDIRNMERTRRFEVFELADRQEESFASSIVDILQDDDEVRKAIILKEVLDRKYT